MPEAQILYDATTGEELMDYLLLQLRRLLESDDRFRPSVTYHVIEELEVTLRARVWSSHSQEIEHRFDLRLGRGRDVPCLDCKGSGWAEENEPCLECGGTGLGQPRGEYDEFRTSHREEGLDQPDLVRERLRDAETDRAEMSE